MSKAAAPKAPGVRAGKVPLIMQLETPECGAACLAMVAAYYGKWVPLEQVRADCGISRDGSSALNIVKAARNYGLEAKGFRYEPEALRKKATFPCIVHWEFNHFIVLRGFRGSKVYVNDPALGEYVMDWDEFDEGFTGICLCFKPGASFEPSGKPASIRRFVLSRIRGSIALLTFLAVTTSILSLLGIIDPILSQIFVDKLLTGGQTDWASPFLTLMLVICVIQGAISLLNAFYLLKMQAKMAAVSNASFIWKVLHLPMSFFSQRGVGDLNQRASSNQLIAQELMGTMAPLLINFLMLLLYAIIMFTYSRLLAAIGFVSVLINLLVARFISKKRINITRVQMREQANLDNATLNGIDLIETLKASGAEQGFFQRWSGYQAALNAQRSRFAKTDAYLSLIPRFVSSIASISVLIIGLYLVFNDQFTIGMILAFQGFLTNFMAPAEELTCALQSFQETRSSMERVQDVMNHADDPLASAPSIVEKGCQKLRGELSLEKVSFGYSPLDPPLIDKLTLTAPAGSAIALVGASGSGKSTVAKLMAGLYQPWEGTIRFDGVPCAEVPKALRCGSVAVVDQDVILFNDTISNNIRLWDDSIEDFEVILAARDACIHDLILQKEGGYEHLLLEGGRDLSNGQRQRLEIARALAQDPTILILDEATSALDAETEKDVMKAIRARGITCIIIAHRLSTIRDCDEILVMDHGRVVERGAHEELLAQDGVYAELIAKE